MLVRTSSRTIMALSLSSGIISGKLDARASVFGHSFKLSLTNMTMHQTMNKDAY